jgi:ABC-2 type transport system permease protein
LSPVEAIPGYIQPISYLLPYTWFVEIIRGLQMKGNKLADLATDYLALAGFALVFIVVSVARFSKQRE